MIGDEEVLFPVSEESADPRFTAAELSDLTANPGGGESPTQQQFAKESDIREIVKRFGWDSLPQQRGQPVFGDFSDVLTWDDATRRVDEARASFMRLPPDIREKFNNDPAQLIQAARSMSEEKFQELVYPKVAPLAPSVGAGAPAVPPAPVQGSGGESPPVGGV